MKHVHLFKSNDPYARFIFPSYWNTNYTPHLKKLKINFTPLHLYKGWNNTRSMNEIISDENVDVFLKFRGLNCIQIKPQRK